MPRSKAWHFFMIINLFCDNEDEEYNFESIICAYSSWNRSAPCDRYRENDARYYKGSHRGLTNNQTGINGEACASGALVLQVRLPCNCCN